MSPKDGEIRKLVGLKNEAFENTKRVLASVRPLEEEAPVEFMEDVRNRDSATFESFMEVLRIARKRLSCIQFRILTMYYGEELTMKEIGRRLGYSESRVSQIHHQAIFALRTKLKKRKGQA